MAALLVAALLMIAVAAFAHHSHHTFTTDAHHALSHPQEGPPIPTTNATVAVEHAQQTTPPGDTTRLLTCNCQKKVRGCDLALHPEPVYNTSLVIRNTHNVPVVIYAGYCTCQVSTTTTIYVCYAADTHIRLWPPMDVAVINLSIIAPNLILLKGQREVHIDVTPVILTVPVYVITLLSLAIPAIINIYRFNRPTWPNLRTEDLIPTPLQLLLPFIFPVAVLLFINHFSVTSGVDMLEIFMLRMSIYEYAKNAFYIMWPLALYIVFLHLAFSQILLGRLLFDSSSVIRIIIITTIVLGLIFCGLHEYLLLVLPYIVTILVLVVLSSRISAALSVAYFVAAMFLLLFLFLFLFNLFVFYITFIQYLLHYDFFNMFLLVFFQVAFFVVIASTAFMLLPVTNIGSTRNLTPISRFIAAVFPAYAEELAARARLAMLSFSDLVEVSVRTSHGEWRGIVEYADALLLRINIEGRTLSFRLDDIDMVDILNIYKPRVRFDEATGKSASDRILADVIVYGGGILKGEKSLSPDQIIVEVRRGYKREFYRGVAPFEVKSGDGVINIRVRYNWLCRRKESVAALPSRFYKATKNLLRISFDESAPKGISVTVEYKSKGPSAELTTCNI